MDLPRPEHPRPQFERADWINLNGTWTFTFERNPAPPSAPSDGERHRSAKGFDRPITVPFAPESDLSGAGEKDFLTNLWYHRRIDIPASFTGKRILLHFGAVFFRATVFLDGARVGAHVGGSSSFTLDLTRFATPGRAHDLVVHVANDLHRGSQFSGKQSLRFQSFGCFYTRTTGIWQTVWMEAVDPLGLREIQIQPDFDAGAFVFTPSFHGLSASSTLHVRIESEGKLVVEAERRACPGVPFAVSVPDPVSWSPSRPHLYDFVFEVRTGGRTIDVVTSYGGLRKIHVEGNRVFLNDQPLYQRLVLDQGFYPDGVWTAPSDAALKRDIELSLAAGFNGARLHQKVFEERFYFWADRLGYLCWAETPSWGLDHCDEGLPARNALAEWREIVLRDRNHPSILAWTPFNETHRTHDLEAHERLHVEAYRLTKALDPTRPVNDASGYVHHVTDLWTVHDYSSSPEAFEKILDPGRPGGLFRNHPDVEPPYEGQPYLMDEFGGIRWNGEQADRQHVEVSWGYGDAPRTIEEFHARLEGLVDVLLDKTHVAGYCYTQLTDVEQEQNGIYRYDRSEKFDMARIRRTFSRDPETRKS